MTRRTMVTTIAGLCGYLYGQSVVSAAQWPQQRPAKGMALDLDGVDGIVVTYKGQRVVITPAEIMVALTQK